MKYVLALDIGNTKTQYLLAGQDGSVMACHRGEGANFHAKGVSLTKRILQHGLEQVFQETQLSSENLSIVAVGAAGLDMPDDSSVLQNILRTILGDIPVQVENDGVISLINGTLGAPGVVITCGTGNANCAQTREGRIHRLGGICQEFGDILGMETMAKRITHRATRAMDGRDRPSILPQMLQRNLGLASYEEIYSLNLESDLAPRIVATLMEACDRGDGYSMETVWEFCCEVLAVLDHFNHRVFTGEEDYLLVLDGHIFREENILNRMIHRAVEARYNCRITVPFTPPVFGAFYLAMSKLNIEITPSIQQNLAENFGALSL